MTQRAIITPYQARYYLTYVPTNYDPARPLPLVFVFHDADSNNRWIASDFRLIEATNNEALLVYPHGAGDPPDVPDELDTSWNPDPFQFEFIDQLLASLSEEYCVNPSRVFAAGFGMGGMFANSLGCERANVFRGIASVAGYGPRAFTPTCGNTSAALPAFIGHGTADAVVAHSDGLASRDFWRDRNGCGTGTMASLDLCVTYESCRAGLPVTYCEHSGGHVIPLNAGANVWRFFSSLE